MAQSAKATLERVINGQITIFNSCARNARSDISKKFYDFEIVYAKCSLLGEGDSYSTSSSSEDTSSPVTAGTNIPTSTEQRTFELLTSTVREDTTLHPTTPEYPIYYYGESSTAHA